MNSQSIRHRKNYSLAPDEQMLIRQVTSMHFRTHRNITHTIRIGVGGSKATCTAVAQKL